MVEIIPRKPQKSSSWVNTIFYFILFLTIIAVALYFVLNDAVKKTIVALEEAKNSISKEETSQNQNLASDVLRYQEKINNFSKVVKGHIISSRIFEFLEKKCHPWVWFSKFSIDLYQNTVNLTGSTPTFETLGQQIIILKEDPIIEKIDLNNVAIEKDGRISFSLTLTLSQNFFKLEQ